MRIWSRMSCRRTRVSFSHTTSPTTPTKFRTEFHEPDGAGQRAWPAGSHAKAPRRQAADFSTAATFKTEWWRGPAHELEEVNDMGTFAKRLIKTWTRESVGNGEK